MNIAKKSLSLALALVMVFTSACNVDKVIASLRTADQVIVAAKGILAPVNPEVAGVMGQVSTDLELVVKAYEDYEKAAPGDKPTKAQLLEASISAIQTNLGAILNAIHVKNPELVEYIAVAVAVVNSAVTLVLSNLPQTVTAQRALQVSTLPIIANAKSAKDLRNAWNSKISKAYPEARI